MVQEQWIWGFSKEPESLVALGGMKMRKLEDLIEYLE